MGRIVSENLTSSWKTFVCNLFKCVFFKSNTYSCRSLINCFDVHSVRVSGPSIAKSYINWNILQLVLREERIWPIACLAFKISIAKSCRSSLSYFSHFLPAYSGYSTPEWKGLKNIVLISWKNKPMIGIVWRDSSSVFGIWFRPSIILWSPVI